MVFYSESISVASTAIGIGVSAKVSDLKGGLFTSEGGDVRYWLDGTVPSSAVGHLLSDGSTARILGINNLRNLLFISTSGTVTVRASYEK